MSGGGWIKLHRKFLEWEWYDDNNTKILFLHCLLMANHKDKKYRGILVKRGEFLTSYELLAKQTHLSVRSVRTSLKKLKSTHEVTSESSRQGTRIQVVNYDSYQKVTYEATHERHTSDIRATSNKNEKNEKNNIEHSFLKPSIEEIYRYFLENENNLSEEVALRESKKFFHFYESKNWMVGKTKMKSWRSAVSGWITRNPEIQNTKNKKTIIGF
jgi:hypothetical protein